MYIHTLYTVHVFDLFFTGIDITPMCVCGEKRTLSSACVYILRMNVLRLHVYTVKPL